jgi:hypothetical protein
MGDNDFPVALGGTSPKTFLEGFVARRGSSRYAQSGTDIPDFQLSSEYNQQMGGPLFDKTTIAGSPSFDLMGPDINSPTVDEWIKDMPRTRLPSPEQMKRNIERIRREVQPIIRRA